MKHEETFFCPKCCKSAAQPLVELTEDFVRRNKLPSTHVCQKCLTYFTTYGYWSYEEGWEQALKAIVENS